MKTIRIIGVLAFAAGVACGAMRPTPEYLKSAVVYQMVLRNFTRDGTFKAATAMLEHVRSVGVDVVYLCPFVEMDRDMDKSGWSMRQKKSGFVTPKNPYRISNYDKIDPEYGDDADFKAFNDKAHALGMKVYMDLVYLHCGPNNVMKDMFPDAFQKNADGSVRTTRWHFPYVNFASKDVRKYLIDYPDISWLEGLENCKRIEIAQSYLVSTPEREVRVRSRTTRSGTTYSLTDKRLDHNRKHLETKRRISESEYRMLCEQTDPALREIKKTRYCLTYENQYFEIDVFPCWDDQALMQIELSDSDAEVIVPPELHVKREVTGDPAYRNAVIASKPKGATH